jgi:endogenous inhibitor of DNA gyrase (YacG/DUF329 family)
MAKKRIPSLRCPICRKIVLRRDPEFPFCSERCRTIDLGKWASGAYRISSPIGRDEEDGDEGYTTGLKPEGGGRVGRPNGGTED